jgi:hypothetical protein
MPPYRSAGGFGIEFAKLSNWAAALGIALLPLRLWDPCNASQIFSVRHNAEQIFVSDVARPQQDGRQ